MLSLVELCFKVVGVYAKEIENHYQTITGENQKMSLPTELLQRLQFFLISKKILSHNSLRILLQLGRHNTNDLDLTSCAPQITYHHLEQVVEFGRHLVYISLSGCSQLTGDIVLGIAEACQELKTMDMSYCAKISSEHVSAFVQKSKKIETLKIERCIDLTTNLNLDSLTLKSVSLSVCTKLISLTLNSPELEFLDCGDCNFLVHIFCISSTKKMKTLNFYRCYELEDNSIATLLQQCSGKTLEEVNLFSCKKITTPTIQMASPYLENALSILLSICINLTDEAVDCVAFNAKKVQIISLNCIQGITDSAIISIANTCSTLHTLSVADTKITDASLFALAKCSPQLLQIDLTDNMCITSAGVNALLCGCPNLCLLSVCQCLVDDDAFSCLEPGKPFGSKLLTLNLTNIPITSNTLRRIGSVCTILLEIDIFGNTTITDEGLEYVIKGCPLLKSLDAQYCSLLTDLSCKTIETFSKNLKDLDLYGCERITINGISLLASSPNMELVELNISNNLRKEVLSLGLFNRLKTKITASKCATF